MEDRQDRLRELGELLRRLRKGAGLTGKELAQRAGVAQPTISRMETGRLLPTPETVERVSAALQLDKAGRGELDALLIRLRDEVSRLKGGLACREAANTARLRSAQRVVSFQSAMIPTLLQTAEYARLALAFGRGVDEEDAAKAAAVRVEAQAVDIGVRRVTPPRVRHPARRPDRAHRGLEGVEVDPQAGRSSGRAGARRSPYGRDATH
ncbi:Scr1 family TA system antitoxin-like transcriptional regulator [Streptosporangium canum]|uniref:Scr1 family TA system antitoxin-like transcriptional regulator n=1 Tax=Streptosporangium canum TaxID=324952 RepID=UPI0037ABE0F2